MLTNMDKLYESVAANGPVCVGLDTEISYLPTTDTAKTAGENVVAFNRALIDATKGVAGCYKVQIAYYESLGLDGMRAYAETLKLARATGLPVIADIKRGDIAKTAEMYAKAHFTGDFEADIITLAPYMGLDSISPYLPYCAEQGKGVFVLCRTSNPGAKDFEYKKLDDGRHVYDLVGDFITLYGCTDEAAGVLEVPYERDGENVRIAVNNTSAATQLIVSHPEVFCDYEIVKGRMDDVFLAVTGHKAQQ